MHSRSSKSKNTWKDALPALAARGEAALLPFGLSTALFREIKAIANIYASRPRELIPGILDELSRFRCPERAFLRFARFLEAAEDQGAMPGDHPHLPRILASIFTSSGALSQRLAAHPRLSDILAGMENPFEPCHERAYYLGMYRGMVETAHSPSERVKALHRMQTAHLMRICARNFEPQIDISEIGAELSALADAVIEICLELAAGDLESRSGIPRIPHTLAVLGLGKLGGRELNVSSDIDLIYLYTERDDSGADRQAAYHTFLAERLTRLLTEPTELGALYRVDTRLRADGASGPLVRAMKDYYRYLEMRGEAWERQMLLKARPVAGDLRAAQSFLGSLEHFIYPSSITRSPHREIVALKNQIEARLTAEGSKKTHLKLMPGGIRDIEFIAQCLQLLMGGLHPEVRSTGTVPTLRKLRELNALSGNEYQTLSANYLFYRRVENVLQWRELLPAFSLPGNPEEMDETAALLGYDPGTEHPGEALGRDLETMRRDVRAIYEEVFSLGETGAFAETSLRAALGGGDDRTRRFLENLGFPNPDESARHLVRLISGDGASIDSSLHPSVEHFVPRLLGMLSRLPDPAGALERLAGIVDAYNARHTLFDALTANPKFFELIMTIAHGSVFLTDILTRDPSLLDWLVEIGEIQKPPHQGEILRELREIDRGSELNEAYARRCLAVKNREELRIGARSVTGINDSFHTFSELTAVAESIVRSAYERALARSGAPSRGSRQGNAFSVIAAGRLGAGMMDFGSDLDLIFIYRGTGEPADEALLAEKSIRLAQNMLALLAGGSGAQRIYEVDARLRPEGGGSVLATSLDGYRKYLQTRAQEWERLAMTRARAVAGDTQLGKEIEMLIDGFSYRSRFTSGELERIMDIRARMAEQSQKRYPGLTNVKSGPGGMADIDFLAQTCAAHYGAGRPKIRHRRTDEILAALGRERLLDRAEVTALTEAYGFLCDTERALRIGSGKSINTLPESGIELARVARLLGFSNIRKFQKRLGDVLNLSRERYQRLMISLRQDAADRGSA
ncbi:MAG: [protein-PII] uridylyltransferase family protein [Candidatus Latescibacterota bacterium]